MIIRKSTSSDSRQIAKVLINSYNIKSQAEAIGVFKNESKKDYHYLVAELNGKIVGIVTWQMHGLPKHGLCELDRIAVLKEYRGKGIAHRLFQSLISDAKKEYQKCGFKLRKLYLMTHKSNKVAQAFYVKMGMKKEAVLKDHFYQGTDELVMSTFLVK